MFLPRRKQSISIHSKVEMCTGVVVHTVNTNLQRMNYKLTFFS